MGRKDLFCVTVSQAPIHSGLELPFGARGKVDYDRKWGHEAGEGLISLKPGHRKTEGHLNKAHSSKDTP